jgi:hypothetical protein
LLSRAALRVCTASSGMDSGAVKTTKAVKVTENNGGMSL